MALDEGLKVKLKTREKETNQPKARATEKRDQRPDSRPGRIQEQEDTSKFFSPKPH